MGFKKDFQQRHTDERKKLLNKQGRRVLVKSVLYAILTNQMSCLKLPKKSLDAMNGVSSIFFVG